ncbi:MAG: NAD(P)/FAD-dependent oxidoreductase [Candidatus Margulisiibacteriota bacterium]
MLDISLNNMDKFDVIVIGGGPAGMMAAGRAAERGAKVLLLEKTYRLGSKLLLTGGGKCNITNNAEMKDIIAAFGKNGKFLFRALTVFSSNDLINFFSSRGLPMRIEPDGRVLPLNNSAEGVLAVLRKYLKENNVHILHNTTVKTIRFGAENKESIEGAALSDGREVNAKKIIVSTGGKSYPATGSTGDGYEIAKKSGHAITPLSPGLSGLVSNAAFIKDLQGLTLKDIIISVIIDGRKKSDEKGDILFTHFGVSGPNILNLSGGIFDALSSKSKVELSLNLRPGFDTQEFDKILQKEFASLGGRILSQYFDKTLPASLSSVFEKIFHLMANKKCSMVNRIDRKKIALCLTDLRIPIIGSRPIEEAIITRGGISLKEIDPRTMESKKVKGLYFCGELLDLAGKTGGYNLQEAFSTGFLAGESAALAGG